MVLYIYQDPERTEVANYCGSSTPTDLSAALGSCLVPRLRDLAGRELFQLPHLTDGSGYHDLCAYDRNWTQPSVLQYVCLQWGSSRTARKGVKKHIQPSHEPACAKIGSVFIAGSWGNRLSTGDLVQTTGQLLAGVFEAKAKASVSAWP